MKFSQLQLSPMRRKGWVKPVIEHKGNTSYDVRDLDRAVDRLQVEGEQALFGSVDEVNRIVVGG
jgi:hypothetical protein